MHGRNPWQPEYNGEFGVRCPRLGFMRTAEQHQPAHSCVSAEYLPNHSFAVPQIALFADVGVKGVNDASKSDVFRTVADSTGGKLFSKLCMF